jgi:MFS family permease
VAHRLGIPELTGPFALGSVAMLAAALVVAVLLRPDPLLVAHAGAAPPTGTSWALVRQTLLTRPVVAAAVLGLASAHAVMVSVMVMTPLHMEHGGATLEVIGVVISVHVLGMFALSPLMGWAADRWGCAVVLGVGGTTLLLALLSSGLSPEGSSWQIFAGLFMLGLGWSAATVSASTIISVHTPVEARTHVQGAADLVMGVSAAAAGGLAGVIVGTWGYPLLNVFAAVLALGAVLAGVRAHTGSAAPSAAT